MINHTLSKLIKNCGENNSDLADGIIYYLFIRSFTSCFRRKSQISQTDVAAQVIRREYDKLGPMT